MFQSNVEPLRDPSATEVRDAFARVSWRCCLEVVCLWEQRLECLSVLEEMGAFAIRFSVIEKFTAVRIVALKGKAGPCYDTGRRAVYRGGAAAVLDDDSHLIVGAIRVCEKTGELYTLWPYREVLSVTEAEPELLALLDRDPAPFDCNTFDADSRRLLACLSGVHRAAETRVAAVYPGPFRALVLSDGSLVRRGVTVLVSSSLAAHSGLLRVSPEKAAEACSCESYLDACRTRGVACILEPLDAGAAGAGKNREPGAEAVVKLDARALEALRKGSQEMRLLLLQCIEELDPYLVLTGSDPQNGGGCCPSMQVGSANRLVEAGALEAYSPPAPPDACTVTFYAFPGEIIRHVAGRPEFRVCPAIRTQVAEALRDGA